MAFFVTTDGPSGLSVGNVTFHGHWTGGTDDGFGYSVDAKFIWGYGYAGPNDTGEVTYATESGSHSDTQSPETLDQDRLIVYEFRARDQDGGFQNDSGPASFKSYTAASMSFGTPGSNSVTKTTATLSVSFTPNTVESVAEATGQYRVQGFSSWNNVAAGSGMGGSSPFPLSVNLSGLVPSTIYEFRFTATRNTSNDTTGSSTIGTFTTLAADIFVTCI